MTKWTRWKFDSEKDARAFKNRMERGKHAADRMGEWVHTNAPDSVAVHAGQTELGLTMQREDRYRSSRPLGM
jgi:hypothetical protein